MKTFVNNIAQYKNCGSFGNAFSNMDFPIKIIIVSVAMLLRAGTSLHGYSGQNKPPMHGDFEAQRHWQEITVNLPVSQWYLNSTENDLLYWGLDYPPLTAYHSLLCGKIAENINPKFTELHSSRGLESEEHKLFMRNTVFAADLLVYIPAVLYFCNIYKEIYGNCNKFHLIIVLFYPGLILIDNGHFQYNNISLGLAILTIAFLMKKHYHRACISFVMALNYKQMELYHAFPIFIYLLANSFRHKSVSSGILKVLQLGLVVMLTFFVLWIPFIGDIKVFTQVVHRIFPFARGIFEDKVSNVWCAMNVIVKLKTLFDIKHLATISALTTLLAIIPSNLFLFLHPNVINLKYSLFTTALSFFLFSFQVHEKSILLAAIPALLLFDFEPLVSFWFLYISSFSMLPLLIKDQLFLTYLVLNVFYGITFFCYCLSYHSENKLNNIFNLLWNSQSEPIKSGFPFVLQIIFYFSVVSTIILTLLSVLLEPPHKYPDIFPLLISVNSCGHFIMFLLYFNIKLLGLNNLKL